MWITSYFTSSGVPTTGLSPTVRVRDLSDNSLVVTDAAMTEVGDGWYKYEFGLYDADKDYAIRCDGTATLDDVDRYTFAGNEYIDDSADIAVISSDCAKTRKFISNKLVTTDTTYTVYDDDAVTPAYTGTRTDSSRTPD